MKIDIIYDKCEQIYCDEHIIADMRWVVYCNLTACCVKSHFIANLFVGAAWAGKSIRSPI